MAWQQFSEVKIRRLSTLCGISLPRHTRYMSSSFDREEIEAAEAFMKKYGIGVV